MNFDMMIYYMPSEYREICVLIRNVRCMIFVLELINFTD